MGAFCLLFQRAAAAFHRAAAVVPAGVAGIVRVKADRAGEKGERRLLRLAGKAGQEHDACGKGGAALLNAKTGNTGKKNDRRTCKAILDPAGP